ncbi:hypothetical protein ACVWZK_006870 [Bradyrhizobium sp. GM0.4]
MTSAVGIVGIDDNGEVGARERVERADLFHLPARGREHTRIFVVGRREDARAAGRRKLRQQLNRRLCAAKRDNRRARAVSVPRRLMQRLDLGARRQRAPRARTHLAHGIRQAVDTGRQIDPVLRATAEALLGLIEISTVLAHALFFHAKARIARMPASSSMVRR